MIVYMLHVCKVTIEGCVIANPQHVLGKISHFLMILLMDVARVAGEAEQRPAYHAVKLMKDGQTRDIGRYFWMFYKSDAHCLKSVVFTIVFHPTAYRGTWTPMQHLSQETVLLSKLNYIPLGT